MTADTQPYIKWLTPEGGCVHGSTGYWPLPTRRPDGSWTPGRALRVRGKIVPCANGLHLCRLADASTWIASGAVPFLVQYRGPLLDAGEKVVANKTRLVRQLRWDDRLARHFACDCAERALGRLRSPDPRSLAAIATARRYAEGRATPTNLAAARDAAGSAAMGAARDAAWIAAWSAAWDAAWEAAWIAAGSAARSAARDAAGSAERQWQGERLWHYFTGGSPQ